MNPLRSGLQRAGAGASVVPDRRAGFWFRDDFLNKLMQSFGVTGTASCSNSVNGAQGHPGLIIPSVAAAATPDRVVVQAEASADRSVLLGGGPITFEHELQIPTLSNGVDNFTLRVGFGDQFNTNADLVNGVYIENDFGNHANSSNWFLKTAKASVRTSVDSGVAAIAATWTRLRIEIDTTGTICTFKVNDVAVGSINTNVPIVSLTPGFHFIKQLGAGAITFTADYTEVMQTFASSR